MTGRALWHDTARMMRAADPSLSAAEIADRLGKSHSCVWKALNPEKAREYNRRANVKRAEQKRAWDRMDAERNRATCTRCGGPMGKGSGRQKTNRPRTCQTCIAAAARERDETLIRRWAEGAPVWKIAHELGTTANSLGTRINRIRTRDGGMELLPYRYREDWVDATVAGMRARRDAVAQMREAA